MEASNPDKVIFPKPGFTKADLVTYYDAVAEHMLPMLLERPLTLHRFPNGVGAKGFMQKNVARHFPESIGRFEVAKQEGGTTVYPVVTEAEHIPWLANQGTITFHIWTSRIPDRPPDWMVLDLDPSTGRGGADVHEVALLVRDVLAEFDLSSHPVVTGSKGFHLWMRLTADHDHHQVAVANRALAGLVAVRHPQIATTEFLKKDRRDRVFVDWLRANRGATVVAPFSLRATATASVAVPVDWDDVPDVEPDRWTLRDVDDIVVRRNLPDRAEPTPTRRRHRGRRSGGGRRPRHPVRPVRPQTLAPSPFSTLGWLGGLVRRRRSGRVGLEPRTRRRGRRPTRRPRSRSDRRDRRATC
ncbi:MAG: non-homologous end-joining DNA ligase [Acidimicrobiia bacterium]|nr:non-homologous end-joining DNA ligase [Acidimicrobiia bacterium]